MCHGHFCEEFSLPFVGIGDIGVSVAHLLELDDAVLVVAGRSSVASYHSSGELIALGEITELCFSRAALSDMPVTIARMTTDTGQANELVEGGDALDIDNRLVVISGDTELSVAESVDVDGPVLGIGVCEEREETT